jgi:predicted nucleotide-binding protein
MADVILIVTTQANAKWIKTMDQAARSLGLLEVKISSPKSARIEAEHTKMIVIDAIAVKDVILFVSDLHMLFPKIPILVATLSPTWRRAREIIEAGAKDYISKSINTVDLRTTLEKWLGDTALVKRQSIGKTPKATILFADNEPYLLETSKEFLEKAGYAVIVATNPRDATRKLETGGIDVAILDLRLENDDDDKDRSGLMLAKNVALSVPKIIITSFPSYDYVREALRPQLDGLPVAVKFIARDEGLVAIREALDDIISITSAQKAGVSQKYKVFVAHGHNLEIRDIVNDFLRSIGLEPISLSEEPDRGDTIIEKFERYSKDVNFAIALFSADDVGYAKNKMKDKRPRGRQNVVFEFGYFLAKLGRSRARLLVQQGVEIPSNISGMLYIEMGSNSKWKNQLIRELKDAGLPVIGKPL